MFGIYKLYDNIRFVLAYIMDNSNFDDIDDIILNALSGTSGGALLGSSLGIIGGLVGGIVGGIVTGYSGYYNRKMRRKHKKDKLNDGGGVNI